MKAVNSQVVFITGGARGIGAQLAHQLAAKGAKLVLIDVDAAALGQLAAELGGDERVLTATADVRDLPAMQAASDKAVQRFGGIDVVVANAGVFGYGSIQRIDPEAVERVLDINVIGVFHTVRATLPAVIERRGYVLIVSSLAAYVASPGMAPYDASKAAVEHFANTLRLEVTDCGVDVGSAHMSWIDTALVGDAKADLPAFREMLAKLPWPLNVTTSVDECAVAFVKGIEGRRRRVYCPRWVELFRWLKPVLSTRLGESLIRRSTIRSLAQMDAEVAALGRSTSVRTESLKKR